mgnify:FL=1
MVHLIKLDPLKSRVEITAGLVPDEDSAAKSERSESKFKVKVTNNSQRFASFQVELSLDANNWSLPAQQKWYRIEPEVCAKKPPGAVTDFTITVEEAPTSDYGKVIPIYVRVFAIEYKDLQAIQRLELKIHPPKQPVKIHLPCEDLKVYPGDRLILPVVVSNLTQQSKNIRLKLSGRPDLENSEEVSNQEEHSSPPRVYVQPGWFEEGTEKELSIGPGISKAVEFTAVLLRRKAKFPLASLITLFLKPLMIRI